MTFDNLESHLRGVSNGMNDLQYSVEQPVTYPRAVNIEIDVWGIKSQLDNCEEDIKKIQAMGVVNVSESQAKVFLAIIEGMIPAIEAVMRQTGMKKRDFAGLALGPVLPDSINPALIRIKSQMASLRTRALTLADSMITFSPPAIMERAEAIRNQIEAKFDEVIRIYSS
ncbi:hypothetical protein AX14_001932 [Amanita brunnescens Koide BX004]|nr:hypothetical protein AX14_001932 [Amanita brunnescens Koide BX004]